MSEVTYQKGLLESSRLAAAKLYDEAFGKKFSVAVRSDINRLSLIENTLIPEYAIAAVSDNKLLGIAGFHTQSGSLTGGITYKELISQLGFIKGNWAALIFGLYERKPVPGELLMDGIAVRAEARGKGIGGKLLDEILKYAKEHDFKSVRLDVIDTNPSAKKLYLRKGFKTVKTESFPYLKWLLGFSGSTTMVFDLDEHV